MGTQANFVGLMNKLDLQMCSQNRTYSYVGDLLTEIIENCVCVCEVAQSCPTLWDSKDCSLPGSSLHGILQARVLGGLPFPSPGDLPNPGIEPGSPAFQADALTSEPPGKLKTQNFRTERTLEWVKGRVDIIDYIT